MSQSLDGLHALRVLSLYYYDSLVASKVHTDFAQSRKLYKIFSPNPSHPKLISMVIAKPKLSEASLRGRTCTWERELFGKGFIEIQNVSKPKLNFPYFWINYLKFQNLCKTLCYAISFHCSSETTFIGFHLTEDAAMQQNVRDIGRNTFVSLVREIYSALSWSGLIESGLCVWHPEHNTSWFWHDETLLFHQEWTREERQDSMHFWHLIHASSYEKVRKISRGPSINIYVLNETKLFSLDRPHPPPPFSHNKSKFNIYDCPHLHVCKRFNIHVNVFENENGRDPLYP